MKLDREILNLKRAVAKSDFVEARRIIELNIEKYKEPVVREKLNMDTITLINSIILFNEEGEVLSRETQLIIQHINKLANEGNFQNLKRYCSLQEELLSNPKVYKMLNSNAKFLIMPPKEQSLA